jgi:type I restriction enzyme R subunit
MRAHWRAALVPGDRGASGVAKIFVVHFRNCPIMAYDCATAFGLRPGDGMITGELRSKIDAVWNAFRAGGIANPLEVIEQITYPSLAGHFARVITYESGAYAQTLIDDFSKKTKAPHIAISVDMLDTGIDVPEVVNLVFFKQVRSKTKFWQMMGRGTRLCPDLFGPGQDKEFFRVFDYCQNLEFFGANPELKDARTARSLSERLFAARLDLVRALDEKKLKPNGLAEDPTPFKAPSDVALPPTEEDIRTDAVDVLRDTVAGLNLDNFIVRQRRRTVEKYQKPEAWIAIDDEKRKELVDEIAPLPSAKQFGTDEAKRFDLLMFSLQLALLKGSPSASTR